MLNRSVDRDYDIAYYKRWLRHHMDEAEACIDMMRKVGYEPHVELQRMVIVCRNLLDGSLS